MEKLSQLAAGVTEEAIEALVAGFEGPEFEVAPNRTLAGAYDGKEPLSAAVISRRLDALRESTGGLQAEKAAWAELAKLRGALGRSRWVALGRSRWVALGTLLGMTGALRKNEGAGAVEKLARLRGACGASGWLKLGAALGAKGAGVCLRGGGV